jgi:hypothetical protein
MFSIILCSLHWLLVCTMVFTLEGRKISIQKNSLLMSMNMKTLNLKCHEKINYHYFFVLLLFQNLYSSKDVLQTLLENQKKPMSRKISNLKQNFKAKAVHKCQI